MALSVLALVACLALPAATAFAHASLTSAEPAPGSTVASSPSTILMHFAEPVDAAHSSAQLIGPGGAPVTGASGAQAVPGDPVSLQITVSRPLATGGYTVTWQTVSATDGHVDAGVFSFGLGVPAPTPAAAVPPNNGSTRLTTTGAVGRWLLYWGLALLVGSAAVCWVALRGALPAGGRVLLRSAWLLAAAGLTVMTLTEKAVISAPSLLALFETSEGRAYVTLGTLVLLSGVAVLSVELWDSRWSVLAVGVTGALAMLAHAVAGHADAASAVKPLNIVAQWVHMLAVGAWIGGLPWLLLVIRGETREERSASVGRYSTMAGVALAAVVLTGLLRAIVEVGSVADLTGTSYGRTLLVKGALVLVIVALGALTRYRLLPALRRRDAVKPFSTAVRTEIAVAAVILGVTAVLTGLAPAKSAKTAAASRPAAVQAAAPHQTSPVAAARPGQVGR